MCMLHIGYILMYILQSNSQFAYYTMPYIYNDIPGKRFQAMYRRIILSIAVLYFYMLCM